MVLDEGTSLLDEKVHGKARHAVGHECVNGTHDDEHLQPALDAAELVALPALIEIGRAHV